MKDQSRLPDLSRRAFARTNIQTIAQRISLIGEVVPDIRAVSEICCGDCSRQHEAYLRDLGIQSFRGLDLEPAIVAANRARGINCIHGNALHRETIQQFVSDDILFFGPPLSEDCDGHRLLGFDEVVPSYGDFSHLLLGELGYTGLLVCICPNTSTMGNITRLYQEIRSYRPDVNLRLIHHSHSTITGNDEITGMRLKYVELWLSCKLEDRWEVRESWGTPG